MFQVSQEINSAKEMYEELKQTLIPSRDIDDDDDADYH